MSSSAISIKGAQGNDALRNLIDNAAFNEWSNGATMEIVAPKATNMLRQGPDGWFMRYFPSDGTTAPSAGGTGEFRVDKRPHTIGQTVVAGNPLYFSRFQNGAITTGISAAEIITFSQRIPNVRTLQNETVALSFHAKGYTSGQKLAVNFTQVFGLSGGDADEFGSGTVASNPVSGQGQEVGLTGDWKKYNLRFNIPSITGKLIGTKGKNYTELSFILQAGVTAASYRNLLGSVPYHGHTVDIANVQLERGVDFSNFENIQQNNSFRKMIGAHITGIASGQIRNGALSVEDALTMTYKGITASEFTAGSRTVADGFYVNLNDGATAGQGGYNDLLKYGRFFDQSPTAGNPIFIVSPSLTNDDTADIREVQCFASTTTNEKVLKIVAFDQNGSAELNLEAVNLMAFQLNTPAPGTFGGGNESNNGDNGGDGTEPDADWSDGSSIDEAGDTSGDPCSDSTDIGVCTP